MIASYAQPGYGFGRVVHALAEHFPRDRALWHFDLAGAPPPAGARAAREDGTNLRPGQWEDALAQALRRAQPESILFYADLETIGALARCARRVAPWIRRAGYCPVEGELADVRQCLAVEPLHEIIAFSAFGAAQLRQGLDALGLTCPRMRVVPHGTDTRHFHPLHRDMAAARQQARAALFPGVDLGNAFIVLNANRNQNRKRLDITLQAFARFAAGKERVHLLLHAGLQDEGVRILRLAAELGIASRLLLPSFSHGHPVVDERTLNLIYNACDVGINTAEAEGWGLVSFEHAATGAAQVVPGYATPGDIWRDHGLLIDVLRRQPWPEYVAGVADPDSAAHCLGTLHADAGALAHWSRKAAENAARMPPWQQVAREIAGALAR